MAELKTSANWHGSSDTGQCPRRHGSFATAHPLLGFLFTKKPCPFHVPLGTTFMCNGKLLKGLRSKKDKRGWSSGLRARLAGTHVLRLKIAIFLEGGCPPWPSHVVINSWPHLSWGYKAWALHEPRKNLRYCLKVSLNFCPDAGQSRSPLAGL